MKIKPNRRKFVQIITCCEEAKLTVLGTSYAIWVETPPMSRIPAVLLRRMALLLSLPGMLTSTTASSSGKNKKQPLEWNKCREAGSCEESPCFDGGFKGVQADPACSSPLRSSLLCDTAAPPTLLPHTQLRHNTQFLFYALHEIGKAIISTQIHLLETRYLPSSMCSNRPRTKLMPIQAYTPRDVVRRVKFKNILYNPDHCSQCKHLLHSLISCENII